ncbi:MAG: hypothetical protein KC486_12495 [Myxococcales bacterium]|nr:hypothetical protein [Myxococcales bacterium]
MPATAAEPRRPPTRSTAAAEPTCAGRRGASPIGSSRSPERPSGRARARALVGAVALASLSGCPRRTEIPPELAAAAHCPTFAAPEVLGTLDDPDLDEVSGLVASRRQPGVLWVHNDSGAAPRLYAIDGAGRRLAEVAVANAEAVDWEDIALGPGPEPGRDYLYVADIGDNRRRRQSVTIYRLPEPDVGAAEAEAEAGAEKRALSVTAEAIVLRYDHSPRNAEALVVDPASGELFVISKETGAADLFAADGEVLRNLGRVDAGGEALVTAADVSPDGRWIAVRTYNRGYLWAREPGEPLADALARPPCPIAVAREPQGEALAFDPGADRLLSLSESRDNGGGTVPLHALPFAPAALAGDP